MFWSEEGRKNKARVLFFSRKSQAGKRLCYFKGFIRDAPVICSTFAQKKRVVARVQEGEWLWRDGSGKEKKEEVYF
ncbi:hypothetical protein D6783_02335 [Candidatus Woesearchaeota archaeon]|nr:MAG: hypothetical protein D6783_02335 [Candidatus Woesearchaeota archaeon]